MKLLHGIVENMEKSVKSKRTLPEGGEVVGVAVGAQASTPAQTLPTNL